MAVGEAAMEENSAVLPSSILQSIPESSSSPPSSGVEVGVAATIVEEATASLVAIDAVDKGIEGDADEVELLGIVLPFPVKLASAPAACMRAMASWVVSHVIVVPALLTKGRAKQDRVVEPHVCRTHFPATHWANCCSTQAC